MKKTWWLIQNKHTANSNLDENKVIQVSIVDYFKAAQEEKGGDSCMVMLISRQISEVFLHLYK